MQNILVPLELRSDTRRVVDQAEQLARALQAKLWVLHVAAPAPDLAGYEAGPQYIRDIRASELKEERAALHKIVDQLKERGVEVAPLLQMGNATQVILEEAERLNVNMIIMGTHGRRGLAKAFLGSTSDDVLRANRYPVMVVPSMEEK